jgi:hypothetical protein
MADSFGLLFGTIPRLFRASRDFFLENLCLRQPVAAFKRMHPGLGDRVFRMR